MPAKMPGAVLMLTEHRQTSDGARAEPREGWGGRWSRKQLHTDTRQAGWGRRPCPREQSQLPVCPHPHPRPTAALKSEQMSPPQKSHLCPRSRIPCPHSLAPSSILFFSMVLSIPSICYVCHPIRMGTPGRQVTFMRLLSDSKFL